MKIGIIGAGNIGGTLTRRLTSLGHEVKVANSRGPETLAGLAADTGATATPASEAVRDADVVIVAIPEKSIPNLPAALFDDAPDDLVVVDTGNYYPQRDGRIDAIEAGTPESRWVAQQLGRPVAVHLTHDGTAAGQAFAGDPDAAVIMLGTSLGVGFPAASAAGLAPVSRELDVRGWSVAPKV